MIMTEHFVYKLDTKLGVLAWKVRGPIYVEDLPEILAAIKGGIEPLAKGSVKLLVDNREMVVNGNPIIFTPEVNDEWIKLQGWLIPYCSRVAVLCNGTSMKLQMDRLARTSGLDSVLRAFWGETSQADAYAFLAIDGNALLDGVS